MVRQIDPFNEASVHALDRIAARALHAGRPGVAGSAPTWSAEIKDRLYRRVFPDVPRAGTTSDAPVPAMP